MSGEVLVTGATGFVGRRFVPYLLDRGWRVRALVRDPRRAVALEGRGAILHRGDLLDAASIDAAVRGCSAIVHLAAVADSSDRLANERVNVGGSTTVVDAAVRHGVEKVLNVSSTCAGRQQRGHYGRTKAEAERVFGPLGDRAVQVRPTMIYGRGSAEWDLFTSAVRLLPLVPVPGTGASLLQPVHLDDALAVFAAALSWTGSSRTWDIAGPEPVTVAHLVEATGAAMGRRRRVLSISPSLPLAVARVLGRVAAHPPLNVDQVLAFLQDTRVDITPARRDLAFDPRPLEEGLADSLGAA